jgi:hypothetical protein
MLSGSVYGSDTINALSKFKERWPGKKLSVIVFDQSGSFGMTVQVSAKADLAGLSTESLYLYAYDNSIPGYRRIGENYRIDANGYLHFTTNLGGDIVISNGPLSGTTGSTLTRETADSLAALPPAVVLHNPTTGGEPENILANYTPVPAVTAPLSFETGQPGEESAVAIMEPEDIVLDIAPGIVPAAPLEPDVALQAELFSFDFDFGELSETGKLAICGLAMLLIAGICSAWGAMPWRKRRMYDSFVI